jgi:glycosyltransferase involved in cell wall biosynthesis
MRNILIFSPIFYPDIGGPAVQGKFLAELLAENGYSVTVIKYNSNIIRFENRNIKVVSLGWDSTSRFRRIFRWIVSPILAIFFMIKFRPQVYLSNSVFFTGMLFGAIYRLFGISTMIKFAGDWVSESTNSTKDSRINFEDVYKKSYLTKTLLRIEKYMLSTFSCIWVISEHRAENVFRIIGSSSNIWTQRNFHRLPLFSGIKNESKALVVCTASRLIPHKRLDQVLKCISELNSDKLVLIICGEGPESDKLKNYRFELNLENKVFILGAISTTLLYKVFEISDLYLSWSSEEGAPNVFIEAMNFELGIVSADVGGISEMFEKDNSALLLDPDNIDALKDCLEDLILHRDKVKLLQKSSKEECLKFTLEYNAQKVLEKFNTL